MGGQIEPAMLTASTSIAGRGTAGYRARGRKKASYLRAFPWPPRTPGPGAGNPPSGGSRRSTFAARWLGSVRSAGSGYPATDGEDRPASSLPDDLDRRGG